MPRPALGDRVRSVPMKTRVAAGVILALTVLGLAVRLAAIDRRPLCGPGDDPATCEVFPGDGIFYLVVSEELANDGSYTFKGEDTAGHPPGYAAALAAGDLIGIDGLDGKRALSGALGALAVPLAAWAAWSLAGRRAAMVAALFVAIHPILWINDVLLLSESLLAPVIAALVGSMVWLWRERSVPWAVAVGVLLGFAGMLRYDMLLIGVVGVVPMVLALRSIDLRRRLALIAVAGLVAAVPLVAWVGFNQSRYGEPMLGTNAGGTLAVANCNSTFYGPKLGYKDNCAPNYLDLYSGEVERDDIASARASVYVRDNVDRLPAVWTARVLRLWGLYETGDQQAGNETVEARGMAAGTGQDLAYVFLVLSVPGFIWLIRRGRPVAPLIAPMIAVSVGAALAFSLTRYRVAGDVATVIAAAVGVSALSVWAQAWWTRRRT